MLSNSELTKFQSFIESNLSGLSRKPAGWMKHPYICLGSHYGEGGRTFFWDSFFMCLRMCRGDFAKEIRGTLDCYLDHMNTESGKVLRLISPAGPLVMPGQDQVQPFLCQFAYLANACDPLGKDAKKILEKLSVFLDYWKRERGTATGLCRWLDAYESGIDSSVALSLFAPLTVAAVDASSFLVMDYSAAAELAFEYGFTSKGEYFRKCADDIADAIRREMWDPEVEMFCNIDTCTGKRIYQTYQHQHEIFCIVPWTNFTPLYAGIATQEQADATIKRYLLNPEHMRCRYGLRSFSKKSVYYTEQRICPPTNIQMVPWLKTASNWTGPVWTISNYMMAHGMALYGFKEEALDIALETAEVNWQSVQKDGGMFENYHPETGKGLWAKDFFSWNILSDMLAEEIATDTHPLKPLRTHA